jgi:hypothetical protein
MLVTKIIDVKAPLTPEEVAEIEALKDRPVVPDDDCPEMSDAEIAFYDYLQKKYNTRCITKEIILNEMAFLSKLAETKNKATV